MRNREDLGLESASVPVLQKRKWAIASLILNALLLGVLAFVTAPRILEPVMSVPPNRYFAPSAGLMIVATIAYGYQSGAWLFFLIALGVSFLSWKGNLDRFNRALAIILLCSCLGTLACIGYSESLPSWVEKTYGTIARERMFAGQNARLLPRYWFR